MISLPARPWLRAAAFVLALAPAACAEHGTLVEPVDLEPRLIILPPLGIQCGGSTGGGGRGGCAVDNRAELIVSDVVVTADTFAFDLAIRNRIAQPLGIDSLGTVTGVTLFLVQGPYSPYGGSVEIANADGVGAFTQGMQPYFEYPGVLAPNAVSPAKRWKLTFSPGVDSIAFAVSILAAVPKPYGWIDVTGTATANVGGTQALAAVKRDALGNVVTTGGAVTWSSSDPSIATVSSSGVVTGVAPGSAVITASDGTHSGSLAFTVTCNTLAVGAVLFTPSNASFCVAGGATGAEFTVVPVNASAAANPVALTFKATGIIPVTGAPSPTLVPGGVSTGKIGGTRAAALRAADAWELRLRRREQAELAGKIPLARAAFREKASGARRAIVPDTPSVGAVMQLNVETDNQCSTADLRAGRVAVVGTRSIVIADTMNPAGGLTTADYQEIANRFDALVWPTLTSNFGAPEDVDTNGRVILFFTRAVNELTPSGAAPVSAGFTLRRDLFSSAACATSNVGEMIYLAAADPNGAVNGNARSVASVKAGATAAAAHELEHVINASRRLYVNGAPGFEVVWLDEGLAHVGEELVFHAASGLAPRANLGYAEVTATTAKRAAFVAYAERNHARLREWLIAPHASGPTQADDDLATRGAAWAFLRFAADRKGGSEPAFWSALVNSTTSGTDNLYAAIGTAVSLWTRDFVVATYLDDAGIGVPALHHPSWNFRALFDGLDYDGDHVADGFPLAPRDPANGATEAFTLVNGGGTAYLRMGVAANGSAVVALRTAAGANPPSPVQLAVIRRN